MFFSICRSARRWLGSAAMLLSVSSIASPAWAEPIASDKVIEDDSVKYREVQQAVEKFKASQFDEALELLEVAAARHPEISPAPVMLARLFLSAGNVGQARAQLERQIIAKPDDPEAYEALANLALAERRITEAGLLYDKVAELTAKMEGESKRKKDLSIRAAAGQATVAETRGNWELARQKLEAWAKLEPKNYRPLFRLGQVLFKLNRPEDAYKQFQAAQQLSDQAANPDIVMGRLYFQSGNDVANRDKAAQWFNQAIKNSPTSPSARVGIAEWLWETGKLDEAKQHADEALKLKGDSLDAHLVRGLIARFQKDYAEAEKQFEAAYLSSPSNFAASNQLALTLLDEGSAPKLRRALELAELNVKQFPNNPEAAATLGAVLLKQDRTEEAARLLQQVLASGTVSGDAAYYLGQLFAKRSQNDEAKKFLRAALDAKGPFANREAAQALLDQISKS